MASSSEDKGSVPSSIEDGVLVKTSGKKKKRRTRVLHIVIVILVVLMILLALCSALTYYLTKWRCSKTSNRTKVPAFTPTVSDVEDVEVNTSVSPSYESWYEGEDVPWMGRLPDAVIPKNYALVLTPYFYEEDAPPGGDNFTFDANVSISILCQETTKEIVLHMWYINITAISVLSGDDSNGTNLVGGYSIDDYHQFLVIDLVEDLVVDSEYVIDIEYLGEISGDDVEGFYRIQFEDEYGETR